MKNQDLEKLSPTAKKDTLQRKQLLSKRLLIYSFCIILVILVFVGLLLSVKRFKTNTISSGSVQAPVVKLQKQYQNPFDKNTQYVNPFQEYKNPFNFVE